MKIKLYSFLVSLIFIPIAALSQWAGLYLGKILYFIYDKVMSLRLSDFISIIANIEPAKILLPNLAMFL